MDQKRNILFGKLSIARRLLTREQAGECFQAVRKSLERGQPLNLWDIAVSRGYMTMDAAKTMVEVVDRGEFICKRGCPVRFALRKFPLDHPFICPQCQGPLQIGPLRKNERGSNANHTPPRSAPRVAPHSTPRGAPRSAPPSRLLRDSGSVAPIRPAPLTVSATSLVSNQRFGNYQIIKAIGRGGMGMVYKARKDGDSSDSALKILLERAADNSSTIERFTREVKVAARLNHQYIVGVKDAGFTHGLYWMAMEFVDGRDLATWRNEAGRSIGQGIELIMKVCTGMAYAHNRFIVHRDLKPGNIMVSYQGDLPKICDFGLAKALAECSELTKTGDILGTPLYMAPEQASGNHLLIGPPTDVWALGVMLYEMATGHLPFQGRGTFRVLDAVVNKAVKKPTAYVATIPQPFEDIILRCLEKDPAKRFRSAAALQDALNALFN